MRKEDLDNLTCYPEPETTLFQQEIDVILALVCAAISSISSTKVSNIKGTLVLDGQKNGGDAKCILRFNLPAGKGVYRHQNYSVDSGSLANYAIDKEISYEVWSKSGIYWVKTLEYLALNATSGRFLCSFFVQNASGIDFVTMSNVLLLVSEIFSHLGKEDRILQQSVDTVWYTEFEDNEDGISIRQFVREAFEKCELPELAAWKAWHNKANQGDLTLFFE